MTESAAQRKLQTAVEDFIREEWGTDPSLVLADWGFVTYHTGWNEEGQAIQSYGVAFMNGGSADHQAIGLFRMAADRMQHTYNVGTADPREDDHGD